MESDSLTSRVADRPSENGGPRRLLPFFPSGFEDELLSSRVGVYHIWSGHSTTSETYRELFKAKPFSLTYSIPPHIDELAIQLPGDPKEQLRRLYQEGTLQPLFDLYLRGRIGQQFDALSRPSGPMPRRILRESGNTRLCIECLAEDAATYGIPYIHRSHQIPATTACWKHKTHLIERCPVCRCPIEVSQDLTLVPWRGCVCGHKLSDTSARRSNSKPTVFELSFARFGRELLQLAKPIDIGMSGLTLLYRARLAELGLLRGSQLKRKELSASLLEHVGTNLLANIDWAHRNGRSVEWQQTLNPRSGSETPLSRHLIMSHFLFGEATQFLSRAIAAAADGSVAKTPMRTPRRGQGARELSQDELFERSMKDLVVLARENGYTVNDLWKTEYGTMKKLVRWNPKAVQVIEGRLARLSRAAKTGDLAQSKPPADSVLDSKWATAIEKAAARLYGSTDRPRRVTMNQLIIEADIRPHNWPTAQNFPKARETCNTLSESAWHFYARKLLWVMRKIPIDPTRKTVISLAAAVDAPKGCDVIQYFIDKGYRPTEEHPMAQLELLGIPKNWVGPYPERQYEASGRAYVPKGRKKPGRPLA